MCRRPIRKDVFDLEELIGTVSSDDGEPEALEAFSKCCLQDGALQLRRITCEASHTPSRLLCLTDEGGGERGKWEEISLMA